MKTNKKSKKIKIIAILVLMTILGVGSFYLYRRNSGDQKNMNPQNVTPATDQEKKETAQKKEEIVKQQEKNDNQDSGDNTTTGSKRIVTITSATAESVYAYVSGVLEDSGECTAIFTKNEQSFQKTSKGFINVSTTQCEPIFLSRNDFLSAGIWQVIVKYSSGTAQGVSQMTTISVQ